MHDGRRLTLRVSGTCIDRNDGTPTVLSIYDDITELVDAQEALRRSETTLSHPGDHQPGHDHADRRGHRPLRDGQRDLHPRVRLHARGGDRPHLGRARRLGAVARPRGVRPSAARAGTPAGHARWSSSTSGASRSRCCWPPRCSSSRVRATWCSTAATSPSRSAPGWLTRPCWRTPRWASPSRAKASSCRPIPPWSRCWAGSVAR